MAMIQTLRKTKHRIELEHQKWRFRNCYSGEHSNLDPELHLREAAAWLKRAQDADGDRGVSYGTHFGGVFLPSYPETTGYIIPTFLRLSEIWQDDELQTRAIEMGDWEIGIQFDSGAVMGGRVTSKPTPAVFNIGMVMLGWLALFESTVEERFLDA